MLNKILSTHLLAAVGVLSISQVFAGEQDLPNLNALAKSHQILTAKENAASVDLEDKEQKLQKSRENLAKAQAALKALVNLKGKKGASLLTAFSSGGFEVKEAGVETKEKEVQVREAVNILSVLSIKNTGVYLSMFRSAQDVREVFAVLVERGMNLIAQGALERNQQKIVEGQKMIQQVAILEAKIPQEVQSKSDEQMLVGLNKLSIQVDQDIVQYKDLQT